MFKKRYYFLWTVAVTSGLYLGKYIYFPRDTIIAAIILLTAVYLSIFIFLYKNKSKKDFFNTTNYKRSFRNRTELLKNIMIFISVCHIFLTGLMSIMVFNIRDKTDIPDILLRYNETAELEVSIKGRICTHPFYKSSNAYFNIKPCGISVNNRESSKTIPGSNKKIFVKIKDCPGYTFSRDDYLEIVGFFSKNDNGIIFNSDIYNTCKVENSPFNIWIFKFRKKVYDLIKNSFYSYMDYSQASFAEGVILGNTYNISKRLYENFQRCGLSHIMAISGLHVSLMIYILASLSYKATGKKPGLLAITFFLIIFCFLIGIKASILRASTMIFLIQAVRKLGRPVNYSIVLCYSYMFLILINPEFISEIGFWLSFSCMAGIVFIKPALSGIIKNLPGTSLIKKRYPFNIFLVTVSINIAIFPLLAYYNEGISKVSVPANIIMIPFFQVYLFSLFISIFFIFLWPPLSRYPLMISGRIFNGMELIVENISKRQNIYFEIKDFDIRFIIIYYFSIMALLVICRLIYNKYNKKKNL